MGPDQRTSVWDWLRFKMRIDISKATTKENLVQEVRRKYGLKKYERATGKQKSVLGLIRKSTFWKESKQEPFLPRRKVGRGSGWRQHEIEILHALKRQGFKGRVLASEFNARVTPNRSYSSIMVKASRI